MKKIIVSTIGLLFSMSVFAYSLTTVEFLQRLNQAGFQNIYDVVYSNGVYKAVGYTKHWNKVKVTLDTTSNSVKQSKIGLTDQSMQMLQVAKKVVKAGYMNIYKIDYVSGMYQVKAYDAKNNKVFLSVDPKTGAISQMH